MSSPNNLTKLRLRNEIGRGARNMANTRRTKRRNNAMRKRNNKAQKNAAVGATKENTMRELDEYIRYCGDLRIAYDKKHGEVREATDKIAEIKRRLSEMSDEILRNLREAQGLNDRNNSSPKQNNSDEILKILTAIMGKIPDGFRDDIGRLTQLQREQSAMINQRTNNHGEINKRLNAIRQRLDDIKNVRGIQSRPVTTQQRGVRGTPSEVNRNNANRRGPAPKPPGQPTTQRARNAKREVNNRMKKSTLKLVTGKGSPLKAQDFKEPINTRSKL
jgi:hypothetical protein